MEAVAGLLVVVFFAAVIAVVVLSFVRPKKVTDTFDVQYPVDRLIPLVHGALVYSARPATYWDGTALRSERSVDMTSWGTKMAVSFEALDPYRSRVTIEDRLLFGLFDWGRLKKEIAEVRRAMDAALHQATGPS